MHKRPISLAKLRRVPRQFSWVDQRLVRDHYIDQLSPQACALYLFLVTVADAQGLSYYSDGAICRRLRLEPPQLAAARQQLVQVQLVAYQKPLYQVLALDSAPLVPEGNRAGQTQSVADILRRALQSKKETGETP